VLEVVEDAEGRFPLGQGRVAVAGGLVGLGRVDERVRLVTAVAEASAVGESLFVAVDGLGGLPQGVAGGAQAVPGGRRRGDVADFAVQVEGPEQISVGLVVTAEPAVDAGAAAADTARIGGSP